MTTAASEGTKYQIPIKGSMVDSTRTTTTHVQSRRVIALLDETVTYAYMKLKSEKSRSANYLI